ncbi:MAG: antibiotic biosynthesis monooxygenase family protein [Pseudomonadota bacterium]|nr:antibiotic biosynthesis monooxygenase family protein [Pseudomonadota bacterium]
MHRRTFMMASGGLVTAGALGSAAADTERSGGESSGAAPRTFVLIEIQAAPGKIDETRETFVNVIKTSHKPGIISAQIFELASAPGTFLSLQEWESEAAFRKHMSDNTEGLEASKAAMLNGTPKLTVLKHLG